MNIAYLIKTDGACDYYRCTLPIQTIGKYEQSAILELKVGDDLTTMSRVTEADIFMMPRSAGEYDAQLMPAVMDAGVKFVTDFDDNLFDVSPLSNHYRDFGLKNVQYRGANGEIRNLWKDGDSHFDIKRNQKTLDGVKRCVSEADGVFVTTEILADVYRQFTDKVYVAPNSVDLSIWKPVRLKRERPDEIRLYWSGGSSHYEDVILLTEALNEIMHQYPQVKLVMMGMNFQGATKGLPQDRFEFHEWVPTPAYPYKTALLDIDISLIPLVDSHFNACKSNIKWVEQGSLLTPSVTSLVSPYKEWYNGVNGVFVENNTKQGWIDGIAYLIENPIERWKMGADARATVEQNFDIAKNYKVWYNAFKEILNG